MSNLRQELEAEINELKEFVRLAKGYVGDETSELLRRKEKALAALIGDPR